jgi:uncharacterized protein (DUF362 family)
MSLSRRDFVQFAATGLLLKSQMLKAQQASVPPQQAPPRRQQAPGNWGPSAEASFGPSKVGLVHGDDRRKNVYEALLSIDDQVKAGLKHKKYVVIKPNNVSVTNQLAATNVDALRGILDYLEPRFKGPVIIAESSAQDTLVGFDNFKYTLLPTERRSQKVSLIDLNREGKYELLPVIDRDLHINNVRLAARVLDPDAYVISSAMLKTHNGLVATLSVKNMVLGSPLHSVPGETSWNDKQKCHPDVRQAHANMLLAAQKLQPNWGLAVIDGFEGMEGDGPSNGTLVPTHVAIASTDLIAADRVGIEIMGINPDWVGYLGYASRLGLGEYDLKKIEVIGPAITSVQGKYKLHDNIQQQLRWMGPLSEAQRQTSSLPQLQDYFCA